MSNDISPEAFEFLVQRAGLSLTDKQKSELRGAYARVAEMAERVRTPRSRAAEPAHIFTIAAGDGA